MLRYEPTEKAAIRMTPTKTKTILSKGSSNCGGLGA